MQVYKDGTNKVIREGDFFIMAGYCSIMRYSFLQYGVVGDRTKKDSLRARVTRLKYGEFQDAVNTSYSATASMMILPPHHVPPEVIEKLTPQDTSV